MDSGSERHRAQVTRRQSVGQQWQQRAPYSQWSICGVVQRRTAIRQSARSRSDVLVEVGSSRVAVQSEVEVKRVPETSGVFTWGQHLDRPSSLLC